MANDIDKMTDDQLNYYQDYYQSEEYFDKLYGEYLRALEIYDDDDVQQHLCFDIRELIERGYRV